MAARAWHLHREEGMALDDICGEVRNQKGKRPSKKCVWNAVRQCDVAQGPDGIPRSNYKNCGRKQILSEEQ